MVDQSGSMSNESVANGKPLAVIAANSIDLTLVNNNFQNKVIYQGQNDKCQGLLL